MGHLESPGEQGEIRRLQNAFAESGYVFKGLLYAFATSDGFRFTGVVE